MKRLDLSVPAFIIAFILGNGAEHALRQSMMLDDSGALIFLERPIALIFIVLGFVTIYMRYRQLRRNQERGIETIVDT